jgi:hypothetical protein
LGDEADDGVGEVCGAMAQMVATTAYPKGRRRRLALVGSHGKGDICCRVTSGLWKASLRGATGPKDESHPGDDGALE